MSEFQAGRASGVFSVGSTIENVYEAYEKEITSLDAMKLAFTMSGKTLQDYHGKLDKDVLDARITIRESEIGKQYISRCIVMLEKLFTDTESKRLQAIGARDALKQVVTQVKHLYDVEKKKSDSIAEFEAKTIKTREDLLQRPVGADPGDPLEEYKRLEEESPPSSQ